MFEHKSSNRKCIMSIAFDKGNLEVSLLCRNGSKPSLKKFASADIQHNFLKDDPSLIGKDIRKKLEEWEIRNTDCIVCLPSEWIMSHQIELPELSAEDERAFINLQAEREFPYAYDELSLSMTKCHIRNHPSVSLLTALPLKTITQINDILKAAKLSAFSITISMPPIPSIKGDNAAIILQQKYNSIDCFIVYHQQFVMMRNFENQISDSATEHESTPTIFRDIRISLGQLPSGIRDYVNQVYLYGEKQWVTDTENNLGLQLHTLGIQKKFLQLDDYIISHNSTLPSHSLTLGAGIQFLENTKSHFEFLPPYISPLQKVIERISSRRNVMLGGTAAAVVFVAILLFGWQQWRLSSLESKWLSMADIVEELETIQTKVKQFNPWFKNSIPSLNAMQTLTISFPEDGRVWSKVLEIKDTQQVSCSGFAESNRDLLSTIDRLNESEAVTGLQIIQVVGESPVQFSIRYQWLEGAGS